MHSPTGSEFEALPPTLKRKCFSDHERSRYAQAQLRADEQDIESHLQPCQRLGRALSRSAKQLASVSRVKPSLPQGNNSFARPALFLHHNKRPQPALTPADISQEDALWFSRLPDKVKRGQFSKEEQDLLAGKQEPAVADAAREGLAIAEQKERSLPSLESVYSDEPPSETFHSEELESFGSSLDSFSDSDDDFESFNTEEEEDMDEEMMTSFRWLDDDEPDLALDDYRVDVAETAVEPKTKWRRNKSIASFTFGKEARFSLDKRSQSHTRLSRSSMEQWGRPRNNSVTPSLPPLPSPLKLTLSQPLPSERSVQPQSAAAPPKDASGTIPASNPPSSTTQQQELPHAQQGAAEHYLNPEARLKLRLYLADPSKFDEALQFGFPTLPDQTKPRTSEASSNPPIAIRSLTQNPTKKPNRVQPLTFLDDGKVAELYPTSYNDCSLSSDSRPVSSAYTLSHPATPGLNSSGLSTPTTINNGKPQGWTDPTEPERDPYLDEWPGREMTLRMTLTRPDLRADEGILYPDAALHPVMAKRMGLARQSNDTTKLSFKANEKLSLEELGIGLDAIANDKPRERGFWRLLHRRW